jgi:hypothetical protein
VNHHDATASKAEFFRASIFLVLCNRLVTCVVAAAAIAWSGSEVRAAPPALMKQYLLISTSNVIATSCQCVLDRVGMERVRREGSPHMVPHHIWCCMCLNGYTSGECVCHGDLLCIACAVAGTRR